GELLFPEGQNRTDQPKTLRAEPGHPADPRWRRHADARSGECAEEQRAAPCLAGTGPGEPLNERLRMIRLHPLLSCLSAALCLVQAADAQQKPPPPPPPPPVRSKPSAPPVPLELSQLRQQYSLKALTAGRMLADQYSNALASLEAQAGDAGDYDTAL